ARVDVLTTLALLSTRETVAVETLARRATCSRFMFLILYKISQDWDPAARGRWVRAVTWLTAGADSFAPVKQSMSTDVSRTITWASRHESIVLPIAAPGESPSTRRRLPAGDGRDPRRRPRGRSGSAAWRDVRRHPRSDERSPH